MFLTWQAVSYLADFILTKVDIGLENSYLFANVFNFVALYCIALPVFLLIIRTIPNKNTPEPYRPRLKMTVWKFLVLLLFCFGVTYIVSFTTAFISYYFYEIVTQQVVIMQPAAIFYGREIFISILFTACVPGLFEEFVFRYLIYKKMRGSGDLPYILFSGFAFGMFHGNFSQMFFATAIGCIYAWIYAKTNVIWYSVGLHFLNNLFAAFILPLFTFTELGIVAIFLFMLACIIVALVLGISKKKKIWAGLSAPSEEGWPEKKEKGWQRKLHYKMRFFGDFNYGVQLKMMEYPPYSTDRIENYEIAVYLQENEEKFTASQTYNTYAYPQQQYNTWNTGAYSAQTNVPYYPTQNYSGYPQYNNMQYGYAGQINYYQNGYATPYYPYYQSNPYGYNQIYGWNSGFANSYNPVGYATVPYQKKKPSIVGFLLKNVGSILFIIATIISSIIYLL